MQHYIAKNLDNHVQVALLLPLKLQMHNERLCKHLHTAQSQGQSPCPIPSIAFSFPHLLKGDILYSQLHLENVTTTLGHLLIWVTISDYIIDQDYFKFTYHKFSPTNTSLLQRPSFPLSVHIDHNPTQKNCFPYL